MLEGFTPPIIQCCGFHFRIIWKDFQHFHITHFIQSTKLSPNIKYASNPKSKTDSAFQNVKKDWIGFQCCDSLADQVTGSLILTCCTTLLYYVMDEKSLLCGWARPCWIERITFHGMVWLSPLSVIACDMLLNRVPVIHAERDSF